MKKTLHILSLLIIISFSISCSSDRDENVVIQKTEDSTVKIPNELVGEWKINYYMDTKDSTLGGSNSMGYFIKFNSNNTIEYKDGNKFGGINDINKIEINKPIAGKLNNGINISIDNIPTSIECRNSIKYQGQVEFKITYHKSSGLFDIILIGTKNK
ncbi:hypothetical protein [Chryseobacterium sp.]|uniref:hypothetical protein n=1 Tax=Chryseobacterium sp. TaxID=1871047 RepID=UPI0032198A34